MFESLAILGRDSTLRRIERATKIAEAEIRRAEEHQQEGD